jgi:hypothetical protein
VSDKASSRQATLDEARRQQRARERRRGFVLVGLCGLVAAAIVGVAAYQLTGDDDAEAVDLSSQPMEALGAPPSACDAATTVPIQSSTEHVPADQQVVYATAPPAFGQHWSEAGLAPAPFSEKYYTARDRPELEVLVHNLEHGYTILWYDETVAGDEGQLDVVEAIADKFAGVNDLRAKFIAAPWTSEDEGEEGAFPDGKHVALSHWSFDTAGSGVLQYCDEPSGAALQQFMLDHPYSDSPEPNAG